MLNPRRRKKAKKYLYYQLMLSLVVILFLGSIGIGYAGWNDFLSIEGTVSTGYIEPVFCEPELSMDGCKGWGQVLTFQQGKRLYVDIMDAQHGDVYFLDFKVKNEGTVPIETESLVLCSGDGLDITFIQEPESIIAGQNFSQGKIKIKVLKVTEDCTNGIMVQLSFRQLAVL
jgi:hypothetical protein